MRCVNALIVAGEVQRYHVSNAQTTQIMLFSTQDCHMCISCTGHMSPARENTGLSGVFPLKGGTRVLPPLPS